MLAARPTCLPLRLVITALRPSAACLLGLACIDGGGSAGWPGPASAGTGHRLEQDRAAGAGKCGQGLAATPPAGVPPPAPPQWQAGSPGEPRAP